MGAVTSTMQDEEAQKRVQLKVMVASMRLSQFWETYGHAVYHYSLVPGVFAYGLWYSGEFTFNPATLFAKILLA
eukprot:CAMPEP_0115086082 /NCGR_PEP_ID=MMETSP0227-20121206/22351_1 /TAXON_ID=89957 /ORGANISM="Polarella glacialis, Strain CCMP 1383" /LENGTH=73 /DNA_ID=CAMNT_0002475427 /DNA_START=72 /DNA_END=293 /DNA_ORIENTATION=-